jgi:segregation and condensation protein B
LKAIIEGLLFVKGSDGLTLNELKDVLETPIEEIKEYIKELYDDYRKEERGIQLEFLGDHFKLTTKPEHREYYKKIILEEENSNLSQSALETLAIVAYNEPITRIEIDDIRGVDSSYIVRKLLIKNLIEEVGRAETPGRAKQYGVTNNFLDYFGLSGIEELPRLQTKEIDDNKENLFESTYKEAITEVNPK